jgi:hypothetical protein
MPDVPLPEFPEKFKLTPEFKLLVACSWIAPPELEQEQAEKVASLCKEEIDWEEFLVLVRRHGVTPLACTLLGRYAAGQMPDNIRAGLKADNIQTVGRSMRQSAEMVRLGKLFEEHSLTPIVMKGVLLSQRLYGNFTLRNSSDIDLMVRQGAFDLADRLVRDDGYECTSPGSNLTERQKMFHRSVGQNYEYFHPHRGIALELHWRSYLWSREQTDLLWKHCEPVSFMGQTFNAWNNDSLLLTLCYHGAHHEWCSLKWLSDIATLLSQGHPDGWESLLGLSGQLGMRRVLAQSALLVQWIYGIPLSGPLCELVNEEKTTVPLATTAIRAMVMSSGELADAGKRLDSLRHSRYLIQLIPTLPYSELLQSVVIRDADFKEFPLPNCLFWLYFPLRPVFWFLRNFRKQERDNN